MLNKSAPVQRLCLKRQPVSIFQMGRHGHFTTLMNARCAGLQELRLTSCTHLSHGCLAHLMNASRLTRLDLSLCKWVDNRDMAILRGYRQLQDLSLACCAAVTNTGKHQCPGSCPTHLYYIHNCLLFAAACNGAKDHVAVLCRYCITVTEHWSRKP